MSRTRLAVLLSAVAAVSLAGSALAAGPNTLTIADAKGDNVSPGAASDITGVTFTTTGSGKGKKYTPKALVITMNLGAPPTSDGSTTYRVDWQVAGCGGVYVSYIPGSPVLAESFNYADCGSEPDELGDTGTVFDSVPEIRGSSLVWTTSLKSLPFKAPAGTSLTELVAFTDFIDPVLGVVGPQSLTEEPLYDVASTEKAYVVG